MKHSPSYLIIYMFSKRKSYRRILQQLRERKKIQSDTYLDLSSIHLQNIIMNIINAGNITIHTCNYIMCPQDKSTHVVSDLTINVPSLWIKVLTSESSDIHSHKIDKKSAYKLPLSLIGLRFFLNIKHYWFYAAMVSNFQTLSKWLKMRECSSYTMCHVSCVTCHVSPVTCHMSTKKITYFFSSFFFS